MHVLREVVYYCGAKECLSEHVYTARINHGIHTTSLYNTPIQHANLKINTKSTTQRSRTQKNTTHMCKGNFNYLHHNFQ